MFVLVQDHVTSCILADFAGLWTARAPAFTHLFFSWLCSFRKICASWWKIYLSRQLCSQISPNLVGERTITAQWEHVWGRVCPLKVFFGQKTLAVSSGEQVEAFMHWEKQTLLVRLVWQPPLYDQHCDLYGLQSVSVSDVRASRLWAHDMIHRRHHTVNIS